MGLFSGSFGTGLVTGLATSVDKSLKDAMDKRDQEMSSARKFWQTRQAQKLDLKEAQDSRAEKALNRLIKEANGDVALGFAAYQAAGGDVDSVESFLTKFDATKSAKGAFALSDALVLPEGFDSTQMKLTRDQAMAGVRTKLSGVSADSIAVDDPLANIGLGIKGGAANKVADKINGLIKPEDVSTIEGYEGVQLDMTKMLEAEKYARDLKTYEKAMAPKNLDEALFQSNQALSSIVREDYESDDEYQNARNKQIEVRQGILRDMRDVAVAEDVAGNTGVSDSIMRVVWTDTREQGRKLAGIGGKNETRYYTDENGKMVNAMTDPNGYAAAVIAADKSSADRFVNTMKGEDGAFTTSAMNIISTDSYLKSSYASLTGETTVEEDTGIDTGVDWAKSDNVLANPSGFADSVYAQKPDIDVSKLFASLQKSGVKDEDAAREAERILAKQNEAKAADATKPKYVPGQGLVDQSEVITTKTPVNDKGDKIVGDVKWNPTSAPTMFNKLSKKSIPENVRMEILEDYVALMMQQGNEGQAERARIAAGLGTD